MDIQTKEYLELYLQNMSEKERKGYHIAKSHLKQSFQLEKSNDFLKWMREEKKKQEEKQNEIQEKKENIQ
jgi:hypothetical protein